MRDETKKQQLVTSSKIGTAIRKRRHELGLSQEQLAELMDISYQQIQRYESGRNRLNSENIQLIANVLSVPVSYFFEHQTVLIGENEKESSLWGADEKLLLKYFQNITAKSDRELVLRVARLAATRKI